MIYNINSYDKFVCFSADTKVSTILGLRSIKEIQPGMIIYSYDFSKNNVIPVKVEKIASSNHTKINQITFSDGLQIKSTIDHPYWVVGKKWCSVNALQSRKNYGLYVDELKVGDECLCLKNGSLKRNSIIKIETISGKFKMYDITGGDNHCFFANSLLVHDENLISLKFDMGDIEIQLNQDTIHPSRRINLAVKN